jgi:hypothetical protein
LTKVLDFSKLTETPPKPPVFLEYLEREGTPFYYEDNLVIKEVSLL